MRDQTEPRKINRIEGVEGMLKALHGWIVQVNFAAPTVGEAEK